MTHMRRRGFFKLIGASVGLGVASVVPGQEPLVQGVKLEAVDPDMPVVLANAKLTATWEPQSLLEVRADYTTVMGCHIRVEAEK